jgi:hypothetical protein
MQSSLFAIHGSLFLPPIHPAGDSRPESCARCILEARFAKEAKMRKLLNIFFAVSLLMSVVAVAQDTMKQDTMSTKVVSVTGKISDDGKTFVSDKDSKSLTIVNPDAVKGHEGHHVTLKAHVNADKNEVHVVSLKMAADSMKKDSTY